MSTPIVPHPPRSKTLREFAEAHRLNDKVVRDLITNGQLVARTVGRQVIIIEDDERAWLSSLPSVLDDQPRKARAKPTASSAKQEG